MYCSIGSCFSTYCHEVGNCTQPAVIRHMTLNNKYDHIPCRIFYFKIIIITQWLNLIRPFIPPKGLMQKTTDNHEPRQLTRDLIESQTVSYSFAAKPCLFQVFSTFSIFHPTSYSIKHTYSKREAKHTLYPKSPYLCLESFYFYIYHL